MRARSYFLSTLKEAPADADVISQQYMIRAGMIKKLAAGVYTYMPVGLRTIRKIEKIIREEMDRAGAIELLMPLVQPAELWQESGRWEKYGAELLRFKDRHDRDFVIQPTSEEVVTDIARQEIKSWRQLPVNFYHIQTKFRDEPTPSTVTPRAPPFPTTRCTRPISASSRASVSCSAPCAPPPARSAAAGSAITAPARPRMRT